jgi:hypothetical protein
MINLVKHKFGQEFNHVAEILIPLFGNTEMLNEVFSLSVLHVTFSVTGLVILMSKYIDK